MRVSSKSLKIAFAAFISVSTLVLLTSFQNCGNFKSNSSLETSNLSSKSLPTPDCYFDGQLIGPRQFVDAFLNSTEVGAATCEQEQRQCVNGALTGSFSYSQCTMNSNSSCLFDGRTIAHGATVQSFLNSTVAAGGTCNVQVRSCSNGVLSGSFNYGYCEPNTKSGCIFNGQTIPNGGVVRGFESSTVPVGSTCSSEIRQCLDGELRGSYKYSSCNIGDYQSCIFDGKTVAHGERVLAFQSSVASPSCTPEVRVCNEGVLSGTYPYASCTAGPLKSCLFAGRTIANGEFIVAYQEATVGAGRSCTSQERLCVDGSFSGTFGFPDCVPIVTLTGFEFLGSPYTLSRGTANFIAPKLPQNFKGTCSVSPALPAGLTLNTGTCAIVGTPSAVSATQDYTVSAFSKSGSTSAAIKLTVLDPPPSITYTSTSFIFTKGISVGLSMYATDSGVTPHQAYTCSIAPALPAGLVIDPNFCHITGTPTVVIPETNFSVTVTGANGLRQITSFVLTVRDVGPSLSYGGTNFSFPRKTTITPLVPLAGGGTILSCSISSTLPTGLSFNTTNCVISGTPTVVSAIKNFQVTARNSGGSQSVVISVTVTEIKPSLAYTDAPYTFARNVAISALLPTNSGGPITSCTIAPTLPVGLLLNPTTCGLSGVPSEFKNRADYVVSATNSIGTATTTISIAVNDVGPNFQYPGTTFVFPKTVAITPLNIQYINPSGTLTSCASSPALPTGLVLNTTNCSITGTPTTFTVAQIYTITGSNSGGSKAVDISIGIADTVAGIVYPGTGSYTFDRAQAIAPIVPTLTGGAVDNCTITPALPAGLVIDAHTCAVSGTPSEARVQTQYTVTAANSGGTRTVGIFITIKDFVPVVTYSPKDYVFTKGVPITPIVGTNTGGGITSCTLSAALPNGMINEVTSSSCSIKGTPTVAFPKTEFIIVSRNGTGDSSFTITITVMDTVPTFNYSQTNFTFSIGTSIGTESVTNTGAPITSCQIDPSTLPAGLSFNTTNCALSGTPTTASAKTNYTVTAFSASGSRQVTISIVVNDVNAPAIDFTPKDYVFTKAVTITPVLSSNVGGPITSCTPTPGLPNGLTLSSTGTACKISGTPTGPLAQAQYVIVARNSYGDSGSFVNIKVLDNVPLVTYSGSPFTFPNNVDIGGALTATNGGAPITNCTVAPALPAGLSISTSTCSITGVPTQPQAAVVYTVTTFSGAASHDTSISIRVTDARPNISYAGSPFNLTLGQAMTAATPTNSGGGVISCAAPSGLPAGINLSSNCTLSGTPSEVVSGTYPITATNPSGSQTTNVQITITDPGGGGGGGGGDGGG